MGRIRTIKPEIAKHELLFQAERCTGLPLRFAWAVLPTVCDREGRFKWRPGSLKTDLLPYDDCDFEHVLNAFVERHMLVKYQVGGEWFGFIPTFQKHQRTNAKEPPSVLPGPDQAGEVHGAIPTPVGLFDGGANDGDVGHLPVDELGSLEGKGREGNKEGKGRSTQTPSAQAVVDLWNTLVTAPIPKVLSLTADRRSKINARLKEQPDLAIWRTVILWVNAQSWCRAPGTGTHPNWVATIDWLVRSDGQFAKNVERAAVAAAIAPRVPAALTERQIAAKRYA